MTGPTPNSPVRLVPAAATAAASYFRLADRPAGAAQILGELGGAGATEHRFEGRHHDDRFGFTCAAPPGVQEELIAADPVRFYRPAYVGGRGWLGVYLDVPGVDWDEIAELVTDSYRLTAPKRLVRRLPGDLATRAGNGAC